MGTFASALGNHSLRRLRNARAEVVLRVAAAALGVAICYLFRWEWLRYATLWGNLRLDALFGVYLQQVSTDAVVYRGALYRYGNACTFADLWCAALPLVWNLRRSVGFNLVTIAGLSAALFAINVFRLSVSDVLFALRVPWWLAHDVLGGVVYFFVALWVWKYRPW